jgi:hypothetical protein
MDILMARHKTIQWPVSSKRDTIQDYHMLLLNAGSWRRNAAKVKDKHKRAEFKLYAHTCLIKAELIRIKRAKGLV